jgi:hypothetical protein
VNVALHSHVPGIDSVAFLVWSCTEHAQGILDRYSVL